MDKKINLSVVGASGLVGRAIVRVLEERNFPIDKLRLFASERSAGEKIVYKERGIEIEALAPSAFDGGGIAIFSAGVAVSREYAPVAAANGSVVVDNSPAWRMDERAPLIVPEVNADAIIGHKGIIANPNCSTIQLVVALKPLADAFGMKRIVVSTYQSISGAGQKGVQRLYDEIASEGIKTGLMHRIAFNAIFHPASDTAPFTVEEEKMINETRKIMGTPSLPMAVTCVRLPILGGHAESLNFEAEKEFTLDEVREALSRQKGVVLMDDLKNEVYPTPAIVEGTDAVHIGRLRRDDSVANGLYLWVVADNLRKGAATNAVQIAELIVKNNLLKFENGFKEAI